MLKIITIFTLITLSITLHAHNMNQHTKIQSKHFDINVSNLHPQDELTNVKTIVDNVSGSLAQKDANKYQSLITTTQSIKAGISNLQLALSKYNLPVTLSSTLCPGVTTFNRFEIRQHIRFLQEKQIDAAKYISTCLDCGFVAKQILQIQNRTNSYNQIVNKTLDGYYCNSNRAEGERAIGLVDLKYSYRKNNLKAQNWYYGSTTASDYKIYAFKRSTTYNLTSCPLTTPFVKDQVQVCFDCPQGSIFNLGAQKCDTCNPKQILNVKSGKCDECIGQKVFSKGQLVCKLCILSQGYIFNETSLKCQKCGKNSYLDTQKKVCVNINCSANTPRFNLTTKTCQACEKSQVIDPNDATNCIETNYIGICPPTTPKYDLNTKKCIVCPAGTAYNSKNNECEKPVSSHFMAHNSQ